MDFGKALEAMKLGKRVYRTSEPNVILYIKTTISIRTYENPIQRVQEPCIVREIEGVWSYSGIIAQSELFAEDWEIVEDIPEVPIKVMQSVKQYFICPKCEHECNTFNELSFETCGVCNTKVKLKNTKLGWLYVEASDFKDVKSKAQTFDLFKEYLEKIINDIELEIMVSSRNSKPSNWQFDHSLSAFRQCLKMLTQLEVKASEHQSKGTN